MNRMVLLPRELIRFPVQAESKTQTRESETGIPRFSDVLRGVGEPVLTDLMPVE